MDARDLSFGTGAAGVALARGRLIALDKRESLVRQVAAWVLLSLTYVALYGMVWDIQWHADVGRDRLFTPPHIMLFSGVGWASLACLGLVLVESWRAAHGAPALNERTTTRVFRIFRAPLGVIMAGFGHLLSGLSAPLDNYWHHLYGLDVTLWSPFHVMGFIGQGIAYLGLIVLLTSEAARASMRGEMEARGGWFHATQLALMLGFAAILLLMLLMTIPSCTWPALVVQLGPQTVFLYPILLGLLLPFGMGMALTLRSPFGATGIAAVLVGARALLVATIPHVVESLRIVEGLPYRPRSPIDPLPLRFLPLTLLLSGVAVDVYRAWSARRGRAPAPWPLGLCAALPVQLTWLPYLEPTGPRSMALITRLAPSLPEIITISILLGALAALPAARGGVRVSEILARVSR